MSRQYQTRTSSQKSSSGKKQPQFTAPPVIQPKADKKAKAELPEWKPGGSGANPLAGLQQTAQAKLAIGQPGDRYEQEADRVARNVTLQINAPVSDTVQRESEIDQLQMKPMLQQQKTVAQKTVAGGEASSELESSINRAKSGGQSLDSGLQKSMGQAMGADFSGVKVHTDSNADRLSRSIQAKAFTTGRDVFFKGGEYNPSTKGGQELIAHELTHVVQQGSANSSVQRDIVQKDDDTSSSTTDTTTTTTAPRSLMELMSGGGGGGGGAPGAPVLNALGDNYPTKANLLSKLEWQNWKDVMIWSRYRSFVPEIPRFVDAVEQYQSSPSYAEMVRIYQTYVERGSEFEVNIAYAERDSIRRRVEAQINGGQQPVDKIFNVASGIVFSLIKSDIFTAWKTFKEDITLKIMANMVRAGMMAEEDLTPDEWNRVNNIEKDYASNKQDLDRHVAQAMAGASRFEKLTGKRKKAAIADYYSG